MCTSFKSHCSIASWLTGSSFSSLAISFGSLSFLIAFLLVARLLAHFTLVLTSSSWRGDDNKSTYTRKCSKITLSEKLHGKMALGYVKQSFQIIYLKGQKETDSKQVSVVNSADREKNLMRATLIIVSIAHWATRNTVYTILAPVDIVKTRKETFVFIEDCGAMHTLALTDNLIFTPKQRK